MDTKDRKERQLTLIEFSEEQQAFNFNEDGQDALREGWMPVAWMPHDEAARFTHRAKLHFGDRHRTLAEVIDYYRFDTEPSITANVAYALGFTLTDELITLADVAPMYPKPTEAEQEAIVTTRNIWAQLLAGNVCAGLKSDEFFDLNTLANIRRYFDKAEEAPITRTALYGNPYREAYDSTDTADKKADGKRSGFVTFGEMTDGLLRRLRNKRDSKED